MTVLHSLLASSGTVTFFKGWDLTGNYTLVDLVAASTNALNGALLARRPDHFKNFTIVGILCMACSAGLVAGSRATSCWATSRPRSPTPRTSPSPCCSV